MQEGFLLLFFFWADLFHISGLLRFSVGPRSLGKNDLPVLEDAFTMKNHAEQLMGVPSM